ncbi:DUF1127 domain-containing protein [Pelagibaculum spongiae]|uniref:YjiS-like domain-containing protein n=1 Tax=Pelagibaculum spongiae TaxID=2080658 RepID=A0A2V1GSP4_9GAMM|nr:DUF1127 domain-containing protein [Pelagibaculum spongiae]PVZ68312.1 hypothetical protein DC094_13580 [Pelagibaculum spongiae]
MHSPAVVNSSELKQPAIESSHQPVVKGLFDTIKLWFARAQQRRQLAQLSDQLLKDIGLERTAALKESRKWFWQA